MGDHVHQGVADADDVEVSGPARTANATRPAVAATPEVVRPRPCRSSPGHRAGDRYARPVPEENEFRLPRSVVPSALRAGARTRPAGGPLHGQPCDAAVDVLESGRRGGGQRHRARARRGLAGGTPTAAGWTPRSPTTRRTERARSPCRRPPRAGPVRRSTLPSGASSTTSCAASTAAPSPTTPGCEQVIACTQFAVHRRPPVLPRAGTSPTSRRSSASRWWWTTSSPRCPTPRPVAESPPATAAGASRFADTMAMSTYLVAFVVGPLEATEPVDVDGTPLRVVHVPGKGHLTATALDVAAFCLRLFGRYYGIAYPGDKVDLVALPDFAAGAMENLGCITFREALLLVDPATSTQQEEQLVADVVAHELAHMWFGDLVTMRWWNGIWLNEAFATFMEIMAVDAYRPDWNRWVTFGLDRSAAFDTDALAATRPVEYEVVSPARCRGHVRRAHLRKGRVAAAHAGAVPGRGRLPRRHPRLPGQATPTPTPRPTTCGTPSRRPPRRAGAADHGRLDLPGGHPLLSVDVDEPAGAVRIAQRRFSVRPARRRHQLARAVAGAPGARRRAAHRPRAGGGRGRARCPCWARAPWWWPTPVVTASCGCATAPSCSTGCRAPRWPGCQLHRALQPGGRRVGRGAGRRARCPGLHRAGPGLRRRARPGGVAGPPGRAVVVRSPARRRAAASVPALRAGPGGAGAACASDGSRQKGSPI